MPSCENTPVKTGYLLQWYPALAAVTGDATYTATWLAEPPTEYEIRFVDYDGVTELQKGNVPAGSMPVPPADPTGKPATSEYTYVFDRWSPALAPATQAITYTAVYKEAAQTYEIRYYKEDGVTLLTTQYLPYGATPTPPVVSKENPETGHTYTLVWKNLTETASIQTVVGDESYKPTYIDEINRYTRYTVVLSSTIPEGCTLIGAGTYDEGASVAIRAEMANGYAFDEWQETHNTNADLGTLTITGDIVLTAVVHKIIPQDLVVDVTDTETILPGQTVKNLVIKSDGMHSGQLVNAENLTVIEDAWFELAVSAQAGTEYMIAVPWLVSVADGIYADGAPWRAGTDGVIYYYDGARRAAEGQSSNCWTAVESDAALQPGKLYKMHWTHAVDTVRFKKQEGAALLTTSLNVVEHRSVTSLNAGWNGIANPALYHAYLNTNATTYTQVNFGQVYLPREERYEIVNMSDDEEGKLIVGAPVIVQVAANQQVNAYTSNPAHQTVQEGSAYYELQLSSGDSYTDRIYLHTLDTKAEGYAIGWDLAKAGVSTQVAQMWVARYNTELCVNTIAPTDSVATYPLGLFVPQEGMYRIRLLTDVPSDMKMRVARGNKVIWNFANGPYEMMLEAGTYTDYSLELVPLNAPDVPFDIENIPDENTRVYKMLKNGQVFIFRAGEQYTITGQKVK